MRVSHERRETFVQVLHNSRETFMQVSHNVHATAAQFHFLTIFKAAKLSHLCCNLFAFVLHILTFVRIVETKTIHDSCKDFAMHC